ncbi:AT-hook motif nuclear-localized protein 5-like [Primulina eburnea]|uniref:AT-hook motif nuclear-localized protein 5-like n=1 Tax=Primulina eburnea TaxID=1245227 RepID=UPI003C6C2A6D
MEVREGMTLPGSAPYYFNNGRGGISWSGNSGHNSNVHTVIGSSSTAKTPVLHAQPVFKNLSNTDVPSVGFSGGSVNGSAFNVGNPSPNFPHGMDMVRASSMSQGSDPVKKKRGRPRKYGPDEANMSLKLSSLSASMRSLGAMTSAERPRRGRPRGTGWKQQLAPLGDWMNSSAGLAFTPHILSIAIGEDIAAKILAFAQQRPRAVCILSANGLVSLATLRQPTASGDTVTYEGRFEILCLSGSYLVAESGSPRNRTGGISISVYSPDGHVIGGAIGGRLIAASLVQVVACSFVYGGSKGKAKAESETREENFPTNQSTEKSAARDNDASAQNLTPKAWTSIWPPVSRAGVKNPGIDLMHA